MENSPEVKKDDEKNSSQDVTGFPYSLENDANEIARLLSVLYRIGQSYMKDNRSAYRILYRKMVLKTRQSINELDNNLKEKGRGELTEDKKIAITREVFDETGRMINYEIQENYLRSLNLITSKINECFQTNLDKKLKELESIDSPILKKIEIEDRILDLMMAELDPEFMIDLDCPPATYDEFLKANEKSILNRSNIVSVNDATESDMLSNLYNNSEQLYVVVCGLNLIGSPIQKKKLKYQPRESMKPELTELFIHVKDFRPLSCLSIEELESFVVCKDSISFVSRNTVSNMKRLIRYKLSQRFEEPLLKPIRGYLGTAKGRNLFTQIEEFQLENAEDMNSAEIWLMLLQINEIDGQDAKVIKAVISLINLSRHKIDMEPQVVYDRKLENYSPKQLASIKLKKSSNDMAVILFLNESDFIYFPIPSAKMEIKNGKFVAQIKNHEVNLPREIPKNVFDFDLCAVDPFEKASVLLFRCTAEDTIIYEVLESSDKISVNQKVPRDPELKDIKSPIESKSSRMYNLKHYIEIFKEYKLYVFSSCSLLYSDSEKNKDGPKKFAFFVNFFDATGMKRDFTFTSWLHYGMKVSSPPQIFVQNTQSSLNDEGTKLSRFVWVVTASLVAVVFEIHVDAGNKRDVQLVAGPSQINLGDLPRYHELDLICPLQKPGRYPGLAIVNTARRQLQTIELVTSQDIELEKANQSGFIEALNPKKLA